jgi:betaine reductase
VIAKEIEREGIPTGIITAMVMVAQQAKASRIIRGVKIPYPCGDPDLSEKRDRLIRREIVKTALKALETDVDRPTEFVPEVEVL